MVGKTTRVYLNKNVGKKTNYMLSPWIIIGYFIACILVGFLGRKTRIGGLGTCLASLLFTPIIVGVLMVVLQPSKN